MQRRLPRPVSTAAARAAASETSSPEWWRLKAGSNPRPTQNWKGQVTKAITGLYLQSFLHQIPLNLSAIKVNLRNIKCQHLAVASIYTHHTFYVFLLIFKGLEMAHGVETWPIFHCEFASPLAVWGNVYFRITHYHKTLAKNLVHW